MSELVGHDKPAAADPGGTHFTFERGVAKLGGENGCSDDFQRLAAEIGARVGLPMRWNPT